MRSLVPTLAIAIALAGCSRSQPAAAPDGPPVIRLPAVPGRPGVAYFVLHEAAGRGALVAVSSPQAGRAEMHETMGGRDMTSMRPIARAPFEHGHVAFAPGGRHVMLFEIDPHLAPGGRAQLSFRFEHGAPLTLDAEVQAAGGPMEHHAH
jgi:periplasmic copper chaperone A